MKEIESRDDVRKLVYTFYEKIREDDYLGPIFNLNIDPVDWSPHLEKMTDFWETNLLGNPVFRGNPQRAHKKVDESINLGITPDHFAHWVELWHTTLDELEFVGDRADRARLSAVRMADGLYMAVWASRPDNLLEGHL